jgi:DNA-binding transcriptional ArsR family regulator
MKGGEKEREPRSWWETTPIPDLEPCPYQVRRACPEGCLQCDEASPIMNLLKSVYNFRSTHKVDMIQYISRTLGVDTWRPSVILKRFDEVYRTDVYRHLRDLGEMGILRAYEEEIGIKSIRVSYQLDPEAVVARLSWWIDELGELREYFRGLSP